MNRTSSWAGRRLVVNYFLAIENNGKMAIDKRDVVCLPLTSRFSSVGGWLNRIEDRAHSLDALHSTIAIDNLCLIHSAKVHAAVTFFFDKEFDV